MTQEEAKQRYVSCLNRLDILSGAHGPDAMIRADLSGDSAKDLLVELDRLEFLLLECHDVIDAPASALDVIGLKPGATYHEAAYRPREWLEA